MHYNQKMMPQNIALTIHKWKSLK